MTELPIRSLTDQLETFGVSVSPRAVKGSLCSNRTILPSDLASAERRQGLMVGAPSTRAACQPWGVAPFSRHPSTSLEPASHEASVGINSCLPSFASSIKAASKPDGPASGFVTATARTFSPFLRWGVIETSCGDLQSAPFATSLPFTHATKELSAAMRSFAASIEAGSAWKTFLKYFVPAGAFVAPSSAGCQSHEDFAKETPSFCPGGITPGTDTDFFLGTASTAMSCGALRTFAENGPPCAGTSFQITRRIDCSGLIQGPPD